MTMPPVSDNPACVAGPPSPLETTAPLPATSTVSPEIASTRRMTYSSLSTMKRSPPPETANSSTAPAFTAVAGAPWAVRLLRMLLSVPVPA